MRIAVFAVFMVLAVVLDTRFMEALRIGPILPSLAGTLAVFVILCAPRQAALWSVQNGGTWISALCTQANTGANALYSSLGLGVVGQYHYRKAQEDSAS